MSTSPFTSAHRLYVKSLYKRMLKLEQDWAIQYTLFRPRALAVRAQFEANRNVSDPRALAQILAKAEADLETRRHADPYIPGMMPNGNKWERNAPPPMEPIFDHLAHPEESHGEGEAHAAH